MTLAVVDIELGPAGLAIAFAAGFVSFISPCVLPLVPGYLSFVSGVGFDELVRMMVDHDLDLALQEKTLDEAGHRLPIRGAASG